MSNLCFLHDIISVSKKVDHSLSKKEKVETIKTMLADINKNLPSFVYVPSDSSQPLPDSNIRRMVIAKIETEETRVFPTKTKTNFSVCFQLISSEEYFMRNFYSYKDNREKVIQMQMTKINDQLLKQNFTPAKLLVNSNMSSQINNLVRKSKIGIRASEGGNKKLDKVGLNNLSKWKLPELYASVRLEQHDIIGEEFPSRNDISQLTADPVTRPRRTSCGPMTMIEITDDVLSDRESRPTTEDKR